jgi:acyl dehydratase
MVEVKTRNSFVTALRQKIGQEIFVSKWFEVSQERIQQFGEVTEDRQWIHMDVERAKVESPFGGTVAHGYLVLALIPHLLSTDTTESDLQAGVKQLVNYGLNKTRFTHPVPAGAMIRGRKTVLEVKEKDNSLDVTYKITVEIQGVERPACVAEILARIYF